MRLKEKYIILIQLSPILKLSPFPLCSRTQNACHALTMTAIAVNTHANIFKKKAACLLRVFAKGRRKYVQFMRLFFPQWFFLPVLWKPIALMSIIGKSANNFCR